MPAKGHWIEQAKKRTRNGKTRVDSADPRHFCLDATIGSLHYKDNPKNESEEWKGVDNIFEPALAPWDWQMLKAGYHIRVKGDFKAGQIIEFEKQGEVVQVQPMALEWTNDLDQIQQISMPQSVTPVISNPEVDLLPAVGMPSHQGTIRWNNGYGQGIDFEWRCTSTRLVKILEIENLKKLLTPEQYILDGGNPVLRLNLIFDPSSGVGIYVDGELGDKKSKKQTFKIIEFRKDGEALWGFMPLRYWDSGNNAGRSVATLEKRGNKLYISIRVPYDWLQNAIYPVFIDADVDEQVDDSADDGYEIDDNTWIADYVQQGNDFGSSYDAAARMAVAIDNGVTVTSAYLNQRAKFDLEYSEYYHFRVKISDEDDAVAIDITHRPSHRGKVSAGRTYDPPNWLADSWNHADILASDLTAIFGKIGWASGNYALIVVEDDGSEEDFYLHLYDYNADAASAQKLHIEYTVAGWTGKVSGVTNPAKVMGVDVAKIAKVKGVA